MKLILENGYSIEEAKRLIQNVKNIQSKVKTFKSKKPNDKDAKTLQGLFNEENRLWDKFVAIVDYYEKEVKVINNAYYELIGNQDGFEQEIYYQWSDFLD